MTRSLVLAAVFSAIASSSLAQSDHVRERDPEWIAPAKAAARLNPLADRPQFAAGGQKLYEQKCRTCHGADGSGTSKAPSLIAGDVQAQTDGAFFWKITDGNTRPGMPSFSFLPEAQRWQLILYLRRIVPALLRPSAPWHL
jgi:mono/diheme cytochrome c family protein